MFSFSALAPRNEFLGAAGGCSGELPGKSVGWDLKHFLSDLWESFSALGGTSPQVPVALQEAATFIQLPGAGKKPGVPVSVLAVFIRGSWDNISVLPGKLWTLRTNKLVHLLFPLLFFFFSLWSPLPLPPPSPSLFPSSLSWEQGVQAVQTPPAAPLIVTASNNGPVERSSGATLSAEGRLPQYSKAAKVYLEEQTANNHLCKPSQDCWVPEKRWNPRDLSPCPRQSGLPWVQVPSTDLDFAQALCVCPSLLKASGTVRQCHQSDRGMVA